MACTRNSQDGSLLLADADGLFELLAGGAGAGGIVGRADVDDVGAGKAGQVGEETIFGRAGHVDNVVVLLGLFILGAGLAHHDGGVDVDGVGGVLDGTDNVGTEHLLDTHDVALGTIGNENFIGGNEVVVEDGSNFRSKLVVALLGAISRVSFLGTELRGTSDETGKDVLGDGLCENELKEEDDEIFMIAIDIESQLQKCHFEEQD